MPLMLQRPATSRKAAKSIGNRKRAWGSEGNTHFKPKPALSSTGPRYAEGESDNGKTTKVRRTNKENILNEIRRGKREKREEKIVRLI